MAPGRAGPTEAWAWLPVQLRETGPGQRVYRRPRRYLVVYQNSGVAANWVRFENAVGSVAEMFVFQTHTRSRTGCHSTGACVVKYDASAVTAAGLVPEVEALISASARGSL